MNEHPPQDSRGLPTLLTDLAHQVTVLFQSEARLLKAEMSEKLSQAGAGAAEVLAGAILLLAALMVLLQALVIALANAGLGAGWSSLLVGVVVAIVGAVLLARGRANLQPSSLTPDRTTNQLRRDAQAVKENVT